MTNEILAFLERDCGLLQSECEDFDDAKGYLLEIVNDAVTRFPYANPEEVEKEAERILESLYGLD